MKVLVVVCHHREDSTTQKVREQLEKGLKESGHEVTTLDLFKIGFNPAFTKTEEPHREKPFEDLTEEVRREVKRLLEHDAIAFVFPMYWFGMPAELKGYIDRVFVHNIIYGSGRKHHISKILWLPLAGSPTEFFKTSAIGAAIETTWNDAIAGYCGISKSKVKFLGGINDNGTSAFTTAIENALNDAYQQGLNFDKW